VYYKKTETAKYKPKWKAPKAKGKPKRKFVATIKEVTTLGKFVIYFNKDIHLPANLGLPD